MKELAVLFAIIAVLSVSLYIRERSRRNAPDPYAQCESKQDALERTQCKNMVNFAMSGAGL